MIASAELQGRAEAIATLCQGPPGSLFFQDRRPSWRMTKLMEQAIETVRALPPGSQDEIARTILHLAAGEAEAEPIDPANLEGVLQGLAQSRWREFATDPEIEGAFRHFER